MKCEVCKEDKDLLLMIKREGEDAVRYLCPVCDREEMDNYYLPREIYLVGTRPDEELLKFPRKLARVEIMPEFLDLICRSGEFHIKVESDLPKDAKIARIAYDFMRNSFHLIYESESFEEIDEGKVIPLLSNVTFYDVNCPLIEADKHAERRAGLDREISTNGN